MDVKIEFFDGAQDTGPAQEFILKAIDQLSKIDGDLEQRRAYINWMADQDEVIIHGEQILILTEKIGMRDWIGASIRVAVKRGERRRSELREIIRAEAELEQQRKKLEERKRLSSIPTFGLF